MCSRYSRVIAIFLALLVANSFAAKSASGKVRSRIGEVTTQKEGKGDWKDLKVGNKVNQSDLIRTLLESQAIIALPDGSNISIEENSLVSMTEVMTDDGKNYITAEIKSGKIKFDVQKQNGGSHFKFKTGTATAAIRGTYGLTGLSERQTPIAALIFGKMDMFMGTQAVSIHENQAIVTHRDKLVVIDLSAGADADFLDKIDSLAGDSTITEEELLKKAGELDKLRAEALKKLKDSMRCEFEALPDTIRENSVKIQGLCTQGIKVGIGGEMQNSDEGSVTFTPEWSPKQQGPKKFTVTCQVGKTSFDCGNLATYYVSSAPRDSVAGHEPLTLITSSPLTVSDPSATIIEGRFDPSDPNATLTVTHDGKVSDNLLLRNPDGHLRYNLSIKDSWKNWNSELVEVEYNSEKYGTEKATLKLAIKKNSKTINTISPTIGITRTDSLKCFIKLNIKDTEGDQVILTPYVDGVKGIDQIYGNSGEYTLKTTKGIHNYNFTAEDLAGNTSKVSKTLGCFPKTNATLDVEGPKKIRLRVPRPPQNHTNRFYQMIRFKVNGLPENNPQFIKRIVISQSGEKDDVLTETDFQGTAFDRQVGIIRGKTTEIKIKVFLKSGETLNATKIYEVR